MPEGVFNPAVGPWNKYATASAPVPTPVSSSPAAPKPWEKYSTAMSTATPPWVAAASAEIDRINDRLPEPLDPLAMQSIVRKHQQATGVSPIDEFGRVQIDDQGHKVSDVEALQRQYASQRESEEGFLENLGSAFVQTSGETAQNLMRVIPGLTQEARDLRRSSDILYGERTGAGGFLGSVGANVLQSVALAPTGAVLPVFMGSGAGGELLDIDERRRMGEEISDVQAGIGAGLVGAAEGIFERYLGVPALKQAEDALRPALREIIQGVSRASIPAVKTALKKALPALAASSVKGAQEEALTSISQDIVRNAILGRGTSIQEIVANAIYSGAAGAAGAAGGGIVASGMTQPAAPASAPTEPEAPQEPDPWQVARQAEDRYRDAAADAARARRIAEAADPSPENADDAFAKAQAAEDAEAAAEREAEAGAQARVAAAMATAPIDEPPAEAPPTAEVPFEDTPPASTPAPAVAEVTPPPAAPAPVDRPTPKAGDFAGAAQTPLFDMGNERGEFTPQEVTAYVRTMEGKAADIVADILPDEPHVLVEIPLSKVNLAMTGQEDDINPDKMEDAEGFLDAGSVPPPIVIGANAFVADGTHRALAAMNRGRQTIGAVISASQAKAMGLTPINFRTPAAPKTAEPATPEAAQPVPPKMETPKKKAVKPAKPAAKKPEQKAPAKSLRQEFESKGVGHKQWAKTLDKFTTSGTILPETRDILMSVFMDTADPYLKSITLRSDARMKRAAGSARLGPTTRIISIQGRLADSNQIPGSYGASEPGISDLNTVLHEFGHVASQTLLSKEDRATARRVHESMSELQRVEFFKRGIAARPEHAWYFQKNLDEFVAQSFAEYVIEKKVSDERMRPLLERLKDVFRKAIARLRNRGHINDMVPVFEKMLAGTTDEVFRGRLRNYGNPIRIASIRQAVVNGWNRLGNPKQLVPDAIEDWITPISSRIRDISPAIFNRLMRMEFDASTARERLKKELQEPAMKITDSLGGRDSNKYNEFKLAVLNGDIDAAKALIPSTLHADLDQFYTTYRNLFDNMTAAGVNIGDLGTEYWPRYVTDFEGLRKTFGKDFGVFEEAWDVAAKLKGKPLSALEKAEIANEVLQGFGPRKPGSFGPMNARKRAIENLDSDLVEFYDDPFNAAFRYVDAATYAAERSRFLGKGDIDESIGKVIEQEAGSLGKEDQNQLRDLLNARFLADMLKTSKAVRWFKQLGYITALGQFRSTITQLTDAGLTATSHGLGNTWKGIAESVKNITGKNPKALIMEDIGLHEYGEEFRDAGKLAEATSKVLRTTGFRAMDRLGKESRINAADAAFTRAANNPAGPEYARLKQEYAPVMGSSVFDQTMQDFAAGKRTENVRYMIFLDVAKVQPIALSQMPRKYLEMPNGRIIYAMKTFTLSQLNFVRREIFRKLRTPGTRVEGLKNLGMYVAFFGLLDLGVEILKDFLRGKEVSVDQLPDKVADSMLSLVGLHRYNIDRAKDDPIAALVDYVTPPHGVIKDVITDAKRLAGGQMGEKGVQSIRNLPLVGDLISYWAPFGRGYHQKAEDANREFNAKLRELRAEAMKAFAAGDKAEASAMLKLYNELRRDRSQSELDEWRQADPASRGERPNRVRPLTFESFRGD